MRTVGIICEYNPFHTGHAYQLEAARRDTGADIVVAVMSEHATQRGELTVADGYIRAESAIRAGIDLVIGLPFPYSAAPAEFFALAGVRILGALGVGALHFGSECGAVEPLKEAAARLYAADFIESLTTWQQRNPTRGIMEGRALLYEQRYGTALPSGSNDLLAMAYLHALDTQKSGIQPYTVARAGQSYNDVAHPAADRHASASALRALWRTEGLRALSAHMPAAVLNVLECAEANGDAPLNADALSFALLSYYRLADAEALSYCADMGGGLAARICHAAREATDSESLLTLAATRRYTDGRLRRALLFGICGVTDEHLSAPPSYVRLLGASEGGCAYLSSIRKTCSLPIVTKPADLPDTPEATRQRAIEERLEALLSLSLPKPREAGYLLRYRPFILKADKKM